MTALPPGRLVSHFSHRSHDQRTDGRSSLWDADEYDLWDRGKPSPALIDFLETNPDVLPQPQPGRRLKALVPGCGKGYDVVMLALHGFNVYGLEVSPKGAEIATRYAEKELANPSEYNYGSEKHWRAIQKGSVEIIAADFFKREWENACGEGGFDVIYDYTFLCALPPSMRKDWAGRMRQLLAPSGILICLEFPMYKDLKAPGPPWGLRGVHWNLLAEGGDGILNESSKEEVGKGAFKKVVHFQPERSYEVAKGTDMLSTWVLKNED